MTIDPLFHRLNTPGAKLRGKKKLRSSIETFCRCITCINYQAEARGNMQIGNACKIKLKIEFRRAIIAQFMRTVFTHRRMFLATIAAQFLIEHHAIN